MEQVLRNVLDAEVVRMDRWAPDAGGLLPLCTRVTPGCGRSFMSKRALLKAVNRVLNVSPTLHWSNFVWQ